jgi:hypothetical protein
MSNLDKNLITRDKREEVFIHRCEVLYQRPSNVASCYLCIPMIRGQVIQGNVQCINFQFSALNDQMNDDHK